MHHARPLLERDLDPRLRRRLRQRDDAGAQRVELPHRQVERRQPPELGVGRGDARVVERHRPADVLPAPVAHPLGREERVAPVARGDGDREVEPARDGHEGRGRGQPFVAGAQQRAQPEQAAAGVPADDHGRRPGGSPGHQRAVGVQAVLVRGGERVLGRQAVVRHHDAGLELLGQHGAVEVVVVERAGHEAAAVAVEEHPPAHRRPGVVVPRAPHPAQHRLRHGDVRRHRVAVEPRHHGAHGAVVGLRIGEVGRDEGEDLGQLAAGPGGCGGGRHDRLRPVRPARSRPGRARACATSTSGGRRASSG